MIEKISTKRFLPAVGWLLISIVLLSLPGDDLPKAGFLDIPYIDKYVHVTMFLLLTVLFSWPFKYSAFTNDEKRSWFLSIVLYVIAYGIVMEFVQKYLVPNRSFDLWDIFWDAFGSFAGYLVSIKMFLRKEKAGVV